MEEIGGREVSKKEDREKCSMRHEDDELFVQLLYHVFLLCQMLFFCDRLDFRLINPTRTKRLQFFSIFLVSSQDKILMVLSFVILLEI